MELKRKEIIEGYKSIEPPLPPIKFWKKNNKNQYVLTKYQGKGTLGNFYFLFLDNGAISKRSSRSQSKEKQSKKGRSKSKKKSKDKKKK